VALNNKNIAYNKYINYLIIIYAFLLPLSRAGVVFLSGVLVLVWLIEGKFQEKYQLLKQSHIILALFVFIVFNIVSFMWSDNIPNAFEYVKKYWYFLPMLVIFTSIQKEYIAKTLSAFILGMFISEIIAYGVFFELWHFKHATPQNPTPFMHHIEYSIFLAFTALVLLGRIFREKDIRYKILYSIFFTTISGNLFLTAGRTGQIGFILGLFVLAMVSFKNKFKAFIISMLLGAFILSVAFSLSSTFHNRMMMAQNSLLNSIEAKKYCTSWGSRIGAWVVSKDMIRSHPIVGIGIDDNMQEFYKLIKAKYPEMICNEKPLVHMHNQYLQILTQTGMIGLILFLLIFYMIAKLEIKSYEFRQIKYIYLTVVLFAFVSEVLLHRQFGMALFALIVGLLLAQNRVENEL